MNNLELQLNLSGCYGIEKLIESIKFHKTNNIFAIYASNGTMKTSLTKTIYDLINDDNEEKSKDQLNDKVSYKREVFFADTKIDFQSENLKILKSYDFFEKNIFINFEDYKELKNIKEVLKVFNERFRLPFFVDIESENFVFIHKKTKKTCEQLSDSYLSLGEQKSFYILKLLLDIEKSKFQSKEEKKPYLIILDDIADSFDYKNKYSIIEYLHELQSEKYLRILVLTHSFDFFSSLNTRLNLGLNKYISMKDEKEKLKFVEIKDRELKLNHFINKIDTVSDLILSIPITRTLLEYENDKGESYKKLTIPLHYKRSTLELKISDLLKIKEIKEKSSYQPPNKHLKYLEVLFATAEKITKETVHKDNLREMLIKNKIILCMAIRIKTEKLGKTLLPDSITNEKLQLGQIFKKLNSTISNEHLDIYRRSAILTPELIHLDLLNYSLMMDLSIYDLINHYKKLSTYEKSNQFYLIKKQERLEQHNNIFNENKTFILEKIKIIESFNEYMELFKINSRYYDQEKLLNIIKAAERRSTDDEIETGIFGLFFENELFLKKLNAKIKEDRELKIFKNNVTLFLKKSKTTKSFKRYKKFKDQNSEYTNIQKLFSILKETMEKEKKNKSKKKLNSEFLKLLMNNDKFLMMLGEKL